MENFDQLSKLCIKNGLLSVQDIEVIYKTIQDIERKQQYPTLDVFVDIMDISKNEMMVIYHRAPLLKESIYTKPIIGNYMKRENEPAIYRTFETSLNSVGLIGETPERKSMKQTVYPIRNKKKNIAVLILETPFFIEQPTFTKKNETVKLFEPQLFNRIEQGILHLDSKGYLTNANTIAKKMYKNFGYRNDIVGIHYDNLSLDFSTYEYLLLIKKQLAEVEDEENFSKEVFFNQSYFQMKFIFTKNNSVIILITDITPVKEKEHELTDKTLMIQEIHHRVKNNLQTVVSLLRIEQRRAVSTEAKQVLNTSISQILAISNTHELLLKTNKDTCFLKEVIVPLVDSLQNNYINVSFHLDIDENIQVSGDTATTLSIISNELIQNSFKHAFSNEQFGTIHISVNSLEEELVEVIIKDDGHGYNPEQTTESIGLTIIKNYTTDKLKGKFHITSSKEGTTATILFKNS